MNPAAATDNSGGNTTLVDNGADVACPLVTTAQAPEALGTEMNDGVGQGLPDGAYDECIWTAVAGVESATLDFYKKDAQDYWNIVIGQPTDVPGVGDKARWVMGALEVLQGDHYFTIQQSTNVGIPDAELLAAAKAAAADVLQSLA